ncbi:MAG: LysE family translocator [Paludibacteraceae bacterium]
MSNLIYIIISGFIIGLFTSVPVGPLGIITIQRTLNHGRWHGLVTGLGAATSDLLYASIVGFSMSFVTDFINAHQFWIQVCGSLIIIVFGIYVFRSNPADRLESVKKGNTSYLSNYISAFLFCLSNPLIIFIFIGLFAQFNFFTPEQTWYENVIGLCSILLGAFSWWLTLTLLVSKLRHRFNIRGLWILNRITGLLLVIIGIIVCVKAIL